MGFRQLFVEDPSRPYRLHCEAQAHPRPVVAGVWYPATAESGAPLTLGDYFALEAPAPQHADFSTVVTDYLHRAVIGEALGELPELLGPDERANLERVLGSAALARRDAAPAIAEGPMLLAHPGLGGAYADNMVLYEYLASRGWLVVAGVFTQATGEWVNVDWDPATSLRDLEILRHEGPGTIGFNPTAVYGVGHSYGAQAMLLYSTMPDRLDAVVSLDSTMDRDPPWWKEGDNAPWLDRASAVTVPALLFSRESGADRGFFDEMGAAPRGFITVPEIAHDDFEGLGGAVRPLLGACPSAEECRMLHRRYQAVVSTTARFLEAARAGSIVPTSLEDERASALGFTWTWALDPAHADSTAPPMPSLEAQVPDCRANDSCDLTDLAFNEALELAALGRGVEALARIEAPLEQAPTHWQLLEFRGQLLASLGRHAEAAAVFETVRALFASVNEPTPFSTALRDRAQQRRDKARALAESSRDAR